MSAPTVSDRLIFAAHNAAQLRRVAAEDTELGRAVWIVKSWQAYRLSKTHQDLLSSSRYRAAATFFVEDLYGHHSLVQRDAELARLIPTLTRFLPRSALTTICEAIELDALSESLDHRVANQLMLAARQTELNLAANVVRQKDSTALVNRFKAEVFDRTAYAEAYRRAGGFAERREQISAVDRIGSALDRLVRKPLLGRLLSSMRAPARAAGLQAIHEFLVRGYTAFKSMGGAEEFMNLVQERERELADALERGDSRKLPN